MYRYVFWALAAGVLAVAAVIPVLRDADGFPTGALCLPVSIAVALAVLGWSERRAWQRTGRWFALALVGQAAALQTIDAGNLLHYQHYRPLAWIAREAPLTVQAILAVQIAAVVLAWRTWLRPLIRWLRRTAKLWQLAVVGSVFGLTSATVSSDVHYYLVELAFAASVQLVNLVTMILAARSAPEDAIASLGDRLRRIAGIPNRGGSRAWDRFPLFSALWVVVLAATLSVLVYDRHPHIPDEVSYLLQARYFAAGQLDMPAPPVPEAFHLDLMTYEQDRWFSPFPPGWPALLAIGVLFGAPWLVNPLFAGLNVFLAYLFLRESYDRGFARVAIVLLCLSPWHIFMSMNLMSHTLSMTCLLTTWLGVSRAKAGRGAWWGWLAGGTLGVLSFIRPLEAATVALVTVLWALGVRGRRVGRNATIGLLLGATMVAALNLPYNAYLTGDPATFPVMAYFDKYYWPKSNALGFGPERGVGWAIDPFPGHGPVDGVINTNLNAFSVNIELFGWSTGSLLLLAIAVATGSLRGRDFLMAACLAAIPAVHFFYYFSGGPDFGARYWYAVLVPCVVLTVRGIERLGELSGNPNRVALAVVLLCGMSLVNYFPWRALDKYHHYLRMRPDARQLAAAGPLEGNLVLIRGECHPDYASAAVYNPLDLTARRTIFVWDRDETTRQAVLSAYPDRQVWSVDGPTVTGAGYRVIGRQLPRTH